MVYAEHRWRRGAAEYRSLGSRSRPGRRRHWRENARLAETAGIELDIASSVAQLYFAMQATFQKIALLQELESIAQFSVAAHEHRTQRGVEDSVDVANARAEQLAARQQIISAEGMLTQYRETLRALIGADAQSMPAIHPVALPALRGDAAAVALFRAAGPPPGPAGAARIRDRLPERSTRRKRPSIPILISKRSGAITP